MRQLEDEDLAIPYIHNQDPVGVYKGLTSNFIPLSHHTTQFYAQLTNTRSVPSLNIHNYLFGTSYHFHTTTLLYQRKLKPE